MSATLLAEHASDYLPSSEAAAFLGLSTVRLNYLRREGRIPCISLGLRTFRYRMVDLQAFQGDWVRKPGRRLAPDSERLRTRAIALRREGLTFPEISLRCDRSLAWVYQNLPAELRGRIDYSVADHKISCVQARRNRLYRARLLAMVRYESRRVQRLVLNVGCIDALPWARDEAQREIQYKRECERAPEVLEAFASRRLQNEWRRQLSWARERLERERRRAAKHRRVEVKRRRQARRRETEEQKRLRRELAARRVKRREQERRQSKRQSLARQAVHSPARLDKPLVDGRRFGDLIPAPRDATDPQTCLEWRLLDSLVGDLSIADIERLDEHSLARLQERLIEAGFAPRGIRQVARDEERRLEGTARVRPSKQRPKSPYSDAAVWEEFAHIDRSTRSGVSRWRREVISAGLDPRALSKERRKAA